MANHVAHRRLFIVAEHLTVDCDQTACDRCEAAHHDGIQFGIGHRRNIGSDEQRRFSLTEEDVGGSRKTLRAACSQESLENPRHRGNDFLE